MKKYIQEFRVIENTRFSNDTALIKLTPTEGQLPHMVPGQFVNILISNCDGVFLRRPISICDVDYTAGVLTLYVKNIGKGTQTLCQSQPGDQYNILLPLGNGFIEGSVQLPKKSLLIGGGVGMAPLLYLARYLKQHDSTVTVLLGGNSSMDFPLAESFERVGKVCFTTVDGSKGFKGFVTDHPLLKNEEFDIIYCCGPTPMMKAVAKLAEAQGVRCLASLENNMACGLGACLCCVENTIEGHKCVCSDGPVFDVTELKWS